MGTIFARNGARLSARLSTGTLQDTGATSPSFTLNSALAASTIQGWSKRHPVVRVLGRSSAKLVSRTINLMHRASWTLLVTDVLLAALSLIVVVWLRYYPNFGHADVVTLAYATPTFLLICAIVFPACGLYTTDWHYPTISDLFRIPRAAFVALLALVCAMFFFTRLQGLPRLAVGAEVFVLITLLAATRVAFLISAIRPVPATADQAAEIGTPRPRVPVLLVGSSKAADRFISALQADPQNEILPLGLLDDNTAKRGMTVRGIPVIGRFHEAGCVIESFARQDIRFGKLIFTEPLSAIGIREANALFDIADQYGIGVARLPGSTEMRDPRKQGRFDLLPIELTDLLQRPQAALDRANVVRLVRGKCVVVTGAGGSIGSELTKQLAALEPSRLVLIENCEYNSYRIELELRENFPNVPRTSLLCDIRDKSRLHRIFGVFRPELVFHAAALKHVPIVELNPGEGVLTNVIGTRNVADAARQVGALAMVQVSSDKAVNTTNVMGATKRVAELYCQALDISAGGSTRFMTVRFGNVLGSSGSLIPLFERQIARGGPVTITDPQMKRFFMTIPEAVELTLQASAHGLHEATGRGEIFVLDMGEPIKIIDIAQRMIRLAGLVPNRDIKIRVVGARPGEKIEEELFNADEKLARSDLDGVRRAIPKPLPLPRITSAIERMEAAARGFDSASIVGELADLVTGYDPSPESRADWTGAASVDLFPESTNPPHLVEARA